MFISQAVVVGLQERLGVALAEPEELLMEFLLVALTQVPVEMAEEVVPLKQRERRQ